MLKHVYLLPFLGCASASGNLGELRISFLLPSSNNENYGIDNDSLNDSNEDDNIRKDSNPNNRAKEKDDYCYNDIEKAWRDDILRCGDEGGTVTSETKTEKKKRLHGSILSSLRSFAMDGNNKGFGKTEEKEREIKEEEKERRMNLITSRLTDSSFCHFRQRPHSIIKPDNGNRGGDADIVLGEKEKNKGTGVVASKALTGKDEISSASHQSLSNQLTGRTALRITVRFHICNIQRGAVHLGGIHVHSPPPLPYPFSPLALRSPASFDSNAFTPRIYTTSGTFGDMCGTRCWLPTIDSAASRHRSSHELTVTVTAPSCEGLWTAGCGEDFGVNGTVLHPVPMLAIEGSDCGNGNDKGGVIVCSDGDCDGNYDDNGNDDDYNNSENDVTNNSEGVIRNSRNTVVEVEEDRGNVRGNSLEDDDNQVRLRKRKRLEKKLRVKLGDGLVDYVAMTAARTKWRESTAQENFDYEKKVHIIPPETIPVKSVCGMMSSALPRQRPSLLATAIWTTSIWTPCPSRSLGFAVGPFHILYDPEYYSPENANDDGDFDENEIKNKNENSNSNKSYCKDNEKSKNNDFSLSKGGGNNDDSSLDGEERRRLLTVNRTTLRRSEGVRQLYLAPLDERRRIHSGAQSILRLHQDSSTNDYTFIYLPYLVPSPPRTAEGRRIQLDIRSVVAGSTSGVAHRALELMRNIIGLPSFRTRSYTQVWLPGAVDGGSSCGTLAACPEVTCNPFLGGGIVAAGKQPLIITFIMVILRRSLLYG